MTTKKAYAAMTDEQREALLERNRQYRARKRAESPEAYEAGKRDRAAAIVDKYRTDEQYRAQRQAAMRERYAAMTPEQKEARRARAAELRALKKAQS